MFFFVDAHIHSKYSRATSKNLDLENLYLWSKKKGINVVGTGDLTHPLWLKELKEKLIPLECGLFKLSPHIAEQIDCLLPDFYKKNPVYFMLQVEISTIYKKFDKVRKVHHVVYAPSFEAADKIVSMLLKIGNLASDGRPILGLDSKDLLTIVLESDPYSYLVPAHIWTPWFSALGSKSGFDSIDECYDDVASNIFAVETGLSSDPLMNWQVSSLDRFHLVSNSDAHSPNKLAREATVYNTELSYFGIYNALKNGNGYEGTIEFFPEEGKYHIDGHRNCSIKMSPSESREYKNICPKCKMPLTIGVLHRVEELASRTKEEALINPPKKASKFTSLIPLQEILSEIHAQGVNTKKVIKNYDYLINSIGSELSILQTIPLEDIQKKDSEVLAEAIKRLRNNEVTCDAGYDGEYGVIRLFENNDLKKNTFKITNLFDEREIQKTPNTKKYLNKNCNQISKNASKSEKTKITKQDQYDKTQKEAINNINGPLLIVAGPGSGKTKTLIKRISNMIVTHGIIPQNILAITFTKRAANEMQQRLINELPKHHSFINVYTFHSLCLEIIKEQYELIELSQNFQLATDLHKIKILTEEMNVTVNEAYKLIKKIGEIKYLDKTYPQKIIDQVKKYEEIKKSKNLIDFEDLILLTIKLLSDNEEICQTYNNKYKYISIDEYQDIDQKQYELIKLLSKYNNNICAIGDPNQAIYSFRGADVRCFYNFHNDYLNGSTITLLNNYRSEIQIIETSKQLLEIQKSSDIKSFELSNYIIIHEAFNEKDEAKFVSKKIKEITGCSDFLEIETNKNPNSDSNLSFGDIAILYRLESQSLNIEKELNKSGMPFSKYTHKPLFQSQIAEEIFNQIIHQNPSDIINTIKLISTNMLNEENKFELQYISQKMIDIAAQCNNNFEKFCYEYTLADQLMFEKNTNSISIMTLHASKGLEFDVVFIIGMEDGTLPLAKCDVDEEKRLLYVGMTRAKKMLFLTRSIKKYINGKATKQEPSPFLIHINNEMTKHTKSISKIKNKQLSFI